MDQLAGMERNSLVAVLNDAEACLLQIEQALIGREQSEAEKKKLSNQCSRLQRGINGLPLLPAIAVSAFLALFSNFFLLVLAAVIVAAILYKKKQRPLWEEQLSALQNQQIPAVENQIRQWNDQLNSLGPWARNVKSLLALLPEQLRNLDSIRGIREQLRQGARDWYTAVQSYQALLREQERDRQIRQMQENVQKVAQDSRQTKTAMEEIQKKTRDIERNTARTAAAAEEAAQHSARAAKAARDNAKANERQAKAAEKQAEEAKYTNDLIKEYINRW